MTRDPAIILDFTNAGTKALDFNNTNWPVMRGVMRGMMAMFREDDVKATIDSIRKIESLKDARNLTNLLTTS